MPATLLHLESMVPCRESQVSSLLSIFGEVARSVLCIWVDYRCSTKMFVLTDRLKTNLNILLLRARLTVYIVI
uniref:Uncharacterized protein n=1 Tax=Gopherus agassizii TaxID=38772 RepID=A0A452IHN2_9SAUR